MAATTLAQILVPTDFSASSAAALKYAVAFAQAFGARLHLLHVVEDPVGQRFAAELAMVAHPALDAEATQHADAELGVLLTRDERKKYQAVLVTERGAPFSAIVKYARREAIDLIVMGTHGRGPVAHLLLGSVAENVVRHAPCPVLTIPMRAHDFVKV